MFGDRVVRDLNRYLSNRTRSVRKVKLDLPDDDRPGNPPDLVRQARLELETGMAQLCGIVRDRTGLEEADALLRRIRASLQATRAVAWTRWSCSTS